MEAGGHRVEVAMGRQLQYRPSSVDFFFSPSEAESGLSISAEPTIIISTFIFHKTLSINRMIVLIYQMVIV